MSVKFQKRALASTASILASAGLFLVGAPAFAQETALEPAAEPASSDVVITVTGIRRALKDAQDRKRDAPVVVDSVSAEDLGDFADTNVADALQRIPGVQIQRNDDSQAGDLISIRGLGPAFAVTTVNGRTPFSLVGSDGRSFNFEVVPTDALQAIDVYKTPSAELVETGLAGLVDLVTIRPLDRSETGVFGALTYRQDFISDQEDKGGPRYSGVVGWKSPDSKWGAYLAGAASQNSFERDTVGENLFAGAPSTVNIDLDGDGAISDNETFEDVIGPGRYGVTKAFEEDERRSVAAGAQWRPISSLTLTFDALYAELDASILTSSFDLVFNESSPFVANGTDPAFFTADSIALEEIANTGQQRVSFLDLRGARNTAGYANADLFALDFTTETDSFVTGFNADYDDGTWLAEFDVSYSASEQWQVLRQGGFYQQNLGLGAITFDRRNGGLAQISLPNSVRDASLYGFTFAGFLGSDFIDGEQYAVRGDLGRRFEDFFGVDEITLKGGIRLQNGNLASRSTSGYGQSFLIADPRAVELSGRLLGNDLANEVGVGRLPFVDYARAFAAIPALREPPSGGYDGRLGGNYDGPFGPQPYSGFNIEEETLALYTQVEFDHSVGSVGISGNAGVRAVRDSIIGTGSQSVFVQVSAASFNPINVTSTFVDRTNERWVYLPSFNLKVEPVDWMAVRFGAAKTQTRPGLQSLVPNDNIQINPFSNNFLTFTGNNVELEPYTAWQYDATLEFYTPNDGAFYISAFFKDVKDFVINDIQEDFAVSGLGAGFFESLRGQIRAIEDAAPAAGGTNPVTTDPRFGVQGTFDTATTAINAGTGRVTGFEIGMYQPFTFLPSPLDGFGLQANYTFTDSEVDGGDEFGFDGASKNNANAIFFYEKYGFGARLAYTYRGNFPIGAASGFRLFSDETSLLDLTLSYDVTDNVQVSFEGRNLTEETPQFYYEGDEDFVAYRTTRPTTFTAGVRFTF